MDRLSYTPPHAPHLSLLTPGIRPYARCQMQGVVFLDNNGDRMILLLDGRVVPLAEAGIAHQSRKYCVRLSGTNPLRTLPSRRRSFRCAHAHLMRRTLASESSLFGPLLITYEKKKLVVSAAINQMVQIY